MPQDTEPSILQKVAKAIDAKAHHMAPGQEVQKHGYDLLVLHEKKAMDSMTPAVTDAEQVTIQDCMPEGERHATTAEEAKQIANNSARPNCVEYVLVTLSKNCLLYTSPSPRDRQKSRMPSSA